MRIDAFELDFIFRTHFTLAEVLNGQAAVLRAIRIRNVRGSETSWLRLQLEIEGQTVCCKSIRKLPVMDDERASVLEKRMLTELTLPQKTMPGCHKLRLLISGEQGSQELLTDIQVLPQNVIPTDFLRAPLLSAYVQESDFLRNFASGAAQHLAAPSPQEVLRCLYDALLFKRLMYQPVAGRQYQDCQKIAAMCNVLEYGGSCAELSLLFASLLWSVGQAPALLLFEDHMAAGCFMGETPMADTLEDAGKIRMLVEHGALLLIDATSVCALKQHPFEIAQREILQHLMAESDRRRSCVLINVQRILRRGLQTVSEATVLMRCNHCGYHEIVALDAVVTHCPACQQPLPSMAIPEEAPSAGAPVAYSTAVQYALQSDGAAAVRLKEAGEDVIHLLDVWRGQSVVGIGDRAFVRSRLRAVILPDTIVRIGDYAFQGCRELHRFTLPDSVVSLGTGAFRDSGLEAVSLPGGIVRIPRLAFAECASLASVTLSEGTQFIDEKAFDGCVRLRSITIPSTVRRVDARAFPPQCQLILLSRETQVL